MRDHCVTGPLLAHGKFSVRYLLQHRDRPSNLLTAKGRGLRVTRSTPEQGFRLLENL